MNYGNCSKCGYEMEGGFLLDRGDAGYTYQTTWVEGEPAKSWFGTLKLKAKRILPVKTLRCKQCGYIELYAAKEKGEGRV